MNGPRQSSLQGALDQHERMLLFSSLAFLILGPSTSYLVPETTCLKWMFGETTISYVKIWNHQIETTTNKWMFEVPGRYTNFCSERRIACTALMREQCAALL